MIAYHPVLKCGIERIEVAEQIVSFYLPPYHCTDMCGAIELAKAINPGVRLILTSNGKKDTSYRFWREKWWARRSEEFE